MIAYRFAYDLYLPRTWAYGDDSERLPGAQVWTSERDVVAAAVGCDCDGRYDDQPHVLVLDVAACSGDTGGCDWPVILPGDLRSGRRVATADLAAWAREQTAAGLGDEPSKSEVRRWAEDHQDEIAAWLDAHAVPCKIRWKKTL